MHMTRTSTETIPVRPRAYSHRWLCERDLPSQLPDRMKASAERLYPTPALAVGISVNVRSEWLKPAAAEVQTAMENAVLEVDADGKLADTVLTIARMAEARQKTHRALFGSTGQCP